MLGLGDKLGMESHDVGRGKGNCRISGWIILPFAEMWNPGIERKDNSGWNMLSLRCL